jgi:hippurate hydrolase
MINHETDTAPAAPAARAADIHAPRTTGGEDFGHMLRVRPGTSMQVGDGPNAGLDHPKFDFDDQIIPTDCSWWVEPTEQRRASCC